MRAGTAGRRTMQPGPGAQGRADICRAVVEPSVERGAAAGAGLARMLREEFGHPSRAAFVKMVSGSGED